jgi:glycerophosphoryl diester phosphodiesterase
MIVAHRGASATESENTLPAFEAAIAAGADAVEFDVRMTADGVAVVMHDADVSRTTDGSGLVRDLPADRVARLRIALREGGDAPVPTLAQALQCCSGRVGVDVEIKNIPGEPDFDAEHEAAVEATVRALDAVAFSGAVLVSSFNPFSLARCRNLAPDVPTGLLADPTAEAAAALTFAHANGHPWVLPFADRVREAGDALVQDARGLGMRLGTWIVDDPAETVRLLRSGIDAVATNDPAAATAAVRAAGLR